MIELRGLAAAVAEGRATSVVCASCVATRHRAGRGRGLRAQRRRAHTVVIMAAMPTAMMSLVIGARSGLRADVLAGGRGRHDAPGDRDPARVAGGAAVTRRRRLRRAPGGRGRGAREPGGAGPRPRPAPGAGRGRGRARVLPPGDRGGRAGLRGREDPARLVRALRHGRAGRPSSGSRPSAAEAGLLVIADAKRGDVDVTSRAYAEAFLRPPIDALTINPSLGGDAVAPFSRPPPPEGRRALRAGAHLQPRRGRPPGPAARPGGLWHEEVARRVAEWGAPSVTRPGSPPSARWSARRFPGAHAPCGR